MKLYRVVEFHPSLGRIMPVTKALYRSLSQARAMRTRHLYRNSGANLPKGQLVFIEETDTEWTKLKQ